MKQLMTMLTLAMGIGMAQQATAQVDYGPLNDFPPVKGQSTYTFLKVSTSPRATAMGEAFNSMVGSVDGIFYNPAGLGFMEGGEFSFSYTNWLVNSKLYTGALTYRLGSNVWGISIVSAKPEAVEETTIFEPNGTGRMIEASDIAIGLAFARRMTDKVSWGLHVRWIREDLFVATSSSVEFDMGISAYTGYKSYRIAASARNVGKEITVETEPFSPPISFDFGLSGEVLGRKDDPSYLTLSVETLYATDFGHRWHVGGEYWLWNMLALRGGFKTNYDVENYSMGFGLKYGFKGSDLRVDVSYSGGGTDFSSPLRIAMGGSF